MARGKPKTVKSVKNTDFNNLKVADVLCPICRTILIEPVTLPCNHGFCYVCFNDTMEHANLVCPLCRLRVGAWFRAAKKENKLIDELFWNAIQLQYPNEIQNKYSGIDLLQEENHVIIVARPGEIRKEYEKQQHQSEEEFRQRKQAEEKASNELIKKITQEEEYRKTVEEEKLKLDAQFARKLAGQLSSSTSKVNSKRKKRGPMDKFVKKSEVNSNELLHNFATKEYTCRVLCLNKDIKSNSRNNDSYRKSVVPVFQKKIQQIQKILESEECNSRSKDSDSGDASDIIESEYRFYFKPIELQKNLHTNGKTPMKVPSKRAVSNGKIKILPPSGKIHFQLDSVQSAFARISPPSSYYQPVENIEEDKTRIESSYSLKRKYFEDDYSVNKKKNNTCVTNKHLANQICKRKTSKKKSESNSESFWDYNNTTTTDKGFIDSNYKKVLEQERADFEFAKKLQAELNFGSVLTRSRKNSKRQVTLDEMLMV